MASKDIKVIVVEIDGTDVDEGSEYLLHAEDCTFSDTGFTATKAQQAIVENKTNRDIHIADSTNPHSVTKAQVGLGNADNTSDADKPVSTAQQAALDLKTNLTTFNSHNSRHLPSGLDPLPTAIVSSLIPDQANTEGTAESFSRSDHIHNIPADTAVNLDADSLAAEGTSTSFSRANHTHSLSTGNVSQQIPDQTNAEGSSPNLARADHIHNIPAATAINIDGDSASTEGTNASFARSNHTHSISTGNVSQQLADQTNTEGSSPNLSRSDHIHSIPTANVENTGDANAQGVANTFSKSDHVHKTIVTRYNTVSNTTVTKTGATADLLDGMGITTPVAGTYIAIATVVNSNSNKNGTNKFGIYIAGTLVANTEGSLTNNGRIGGIANKMTYAISVEVTVNGTQNVEIYWSETGSGANTCYLRSLTLIKVS